MHSICWLVFHHKCIYNNTALNTIVRIHNDIQNCSKKKKKNRLQDVAFESMSFTLDVYEKQSIECVFPTNLNKKCVDVQNTDTMCFVTPFDNYTHGRVGCVCMCDMAILLIEII